MKESKRTRAVRLKRLGRLTRIERKVDREWTEGYVVGVGTKLLLLLIVDEAHRYNGFHIYRLSDITCIDTAPYATFVERALRKRKLRRPRTPTIGLNTIQQAIRDSAKRFPLLCIHCESKTPDICHIGKPLSVSTKELRLHTISPAAEWNVRPTDLRIAQISRIDVGGGYEESLHLVGGDG